MNRENNIPVSKVLQFTSMDSVLEFNMIIEGLLYYSIKLCILPIHLNYCYINSKNNSELSKH